MPAATGPAYVPARPDGAANDSGGAFSFLDRFFGAGAREAVTEKALDARAAVAGRAQDARANLSAAGTNLAATARAHPVLAVLTVVGGIAAIALLANPATRRAAIAGGTALWGKYGDRLPGLLPKP
ncbi:MAG: hypothetical protein JWR84_1283 [Caulobacter sp.]|nr:hypothetical protein [Caulobacter sp.]